MSSRRVVRPEGRFSLLLLGLLQVSIVSHLTGLICGTRYPLNARDMENLNLQRSMAWIRPLHERDHSMRNLLQVDDTSSKQSGKEKKAEHENLKDGQTEKRQQESEETNIVESFAPKTKQQKLELEEKNVEEPELEVKKVEKPEMKYEEKQPDLETEQKKVEQPEFQNEDQKSQEKINQEPALNNTQESVKTKVEEADIKTVNLENGKVEERDQEGKKVDHEVPELKTEEQEPVSEFEQRRREQVIAAKQKSQNKTEADQKEKDEDLSFIFRRPYLLGPPIKDWDEQRGAWLETNPIMKTMPNGKPRVLIVTGSQPQPCNSPIGDKINVKSFKLKIDYARMHGYELYYNFVWLDPLFGSYWVKLPTLRKLMLTHPEIEWFLWIDSDAFFTDMLFEPPWDNYEGFNMIMWGYEQGLYTDKSWVSFNAGVFLIRNCQWSLDLIDKWSPMGPEGPVRNAFGKILTATLPDRGDCDADDQSALGYLMITDEAIKSKVKLVLHTEYQISGYYIRLDKTFESCMENYYPGLGDERWPWITHFTGCGPCHEDHTTPFYQSCFRKIERAFNFADNQVLAYMGFQHESLNSSKVIRTRNESSQPLEFVGVNPWADRIAKVAAAAAAEKGTT